MILHTSVRKCICLYGSI